MKVTLLGHTQTTINVPPYLHDLDATDGQIIALGAIRQCYSHKTVEQIYMSEGEKYFGEQGKEGQRLFNHIVKSGHTSTLEHIHFTFAVEGVSRALLAQLTRHRQLSFSVQSQRYNDLKTTSRSQGFNYAIPDSIYNADDEEVLNEFLDTMVQIQWSYDKLRKLGVPQEDARSILPNAATCNLVTSGNLRAWLEFYSKRKKGNGAQAEIAEFAEHIKNAIVEVEPWTNEYFNLE